MVFITTFQEDLKAVCAVTVESQVAGLKECHLHFFHSQFLPWCVFLKTLDSIVCSHAHPASLYLSPFSLLGVDIRRGGGGAKKILLNYVTKLKKSTNFSTLPQLMGQ